MYVQLFVYDFPVKQIQTTDSHPITMTVYRVTGIIRSCHRTRKLRLGVTTASRTGGSILLVLLGTIQSFGSGIQFTWVHIGRIKYIIAKNKSTDQIGNPDLLNFKSILRPIGPRTYLSRMKSPRSCVGTYTKARYKAVQLFWLIQSTLAWILFGAGGLRASKK